MATPLTATQMVTILRTEGLTVHEVRDWRTHNRNHKGAWGPVNGVMIHHTVTKGTANTVAICYDGYTGLPGPLCHGVIDKAGHVHLVGNGRANHAGSGDGDVLTAVINETALPADNETDTDGNRHFYGFECENLGDGQDPWPAAQLEAIERVSAAICRHHGWGAGSVIGHLEWQPGKSDPRGFTMQTMRGRVAARLDGNQQQEEDVALTPDEIEKVADRVVEKLFKADVINAVAPPDENADWHDGNTKWSFGYAVHSPNVVGRETRRLVRDLNEKVDSIAVGGVDLDALAVKVADLLAARLAQ
ncbi:MAG TPA: N-acetylmuramoyl-L-alanine amidase [Nocardioides sp.]